MKADVRDGVRCWNEPWPRFEALSIRSTRSMPPRAGTAIMGRTMLKGLRAAASATEDRRPDKAFAQGRRRASGSAIAPSHRGPLTKITGRAGGLQRWAIAAEADHDAGPNQGGAIDDARTRSFASREPAAGHWLEAAGQAATGRD